MRNCAPATRLSHHQNQWLHQLDTESYNNESAMMTLNKSLRLLCCLLLGSATVSPQKAPKVKCEHAAPPPRTHYVCDNPQNPCWCRIEPDDPNAPSGEYSKDLSTLDRRVWVDPHRKLFYCSEKKPAKLPKHFLRLTEEEARRHGYKPAPHGLCAQADDARR